MPPVLRQFLVAAALVASAAAQVRTFGAAEFRSETPTGSTVLDAVAAAKVALNADLRNVVVVRLGDGPVLAMRIDVRSMIQTGDTATNLVLRDGDLLFVPTGAEGSRDAFAAAAAHLSGSPSARDRTMALCLQAVTATGAEFRAHALRELCEADPDLPCVLPTLRAGLLDADPSVVREAVTALGAHGARARAAADELRGLVDHRDAQIRARARAALERVCESTSKSRG